MPFHENLRTLRLARGLTQPSLAAKAEIEQSYLSKLENGRSRPSEDVLARLAQALEVKAEALLQSGDEAEDGTHRWRKVLATTGIVLALLTVFLLGRATAMYPLTLSKIVRGAHADENLVLAVKDLAPKEIDVITVTGDWSDTHLNVSGITTNYAALDTYMKTIKSKFGGTFTLIHMDPDGSSDNRHFDIQYERSGVR